MTNAQTRPGVPPIALDGATEDVSVGGAGVPPSRGWHHWLRVLRLSKRQRWWLLGLVAAAAVIVIGTPIADGDTASDLWRSLDATAQNLGQMPWQIAPVLVVISLLHYLAAAIALRAASGRPLPLRESVWVQFAAAAANRFTPAGIGGAAVNARFLTRLGLPMVQSVGTVAILGGLGAIADFLIFVGLVVAGKWVGISGGSHELTALGSKLKAPLRILGGLPSPLLPTIASVVAFAIIFVLWQRIRTRRKARAAEDGSASRLYGLWHMLVELGRSPTRMLTLLTASAATTMLLASGFAISALAVSPTPSLGFGSLFIGYLIGGAVGTAVPAPAAVGSTEAALVAVLITAHVPAGSALSTVLLFRLITFWTPAVLGLFAIRHLRRRHEF
jgi:uncharacterized membrane protein YbhN (UPF0104 family)